MWEQMAEKLYETIGVVSAITYIVSTVASLVLLLAYHLIPVSIFALLHLLCAIIAIFAVFGMVYWWLRSNAFTESIIQEKI